VRIRRSWKLCCLCIRNWRKVHCGRRPDCRGCRGRRKGCCTRSSRKTGALSQRSAHHSCQTLTDSTLATKQGRESREAAICGGSGLRGPRHRSCALLFLPAVKYKSVVQIMGGWRLAILLILEQLMGRSHRFSELANLDG
jgi:hypothetical protein